jgi:DNA-binding NarL/FixJ family response regulator
MTAPLSRRERQVLILAAGGCTTKEIAHRLRIGERTVKLHFTNSYVKLEAANRAQAIAKAIVSGDVRRLPPRRRGRSHTAKS